MIMADGAPEVTPLFLSLSLLRVEGKAPSFTPLRNDYYYIVIIIPLTANDPYGCGNGEEELLHPGQSVTGSRLLRADFSYSRRIAANAVFDQNGSTLTKDRGEGDAAPNKVKDEISDMIIARDDERIVV